MSPSAAAAGTVRLPRLLALVPYLLSRPGARLPEVAALFSISEKQLRKDLDLLFVCGLPGHGPGDLIDVHYSGDTVTLSNAETIGRPLRLTPDEATALLVAVRALADLPELTERAALDRLLAKLEQAAGAAAVAADGVAVALEDPTAVLAAVRDALARGRLMHLTYHVPGRDEDTERQVDPVQVLHTQGHWYLEAWCRKVEAVRLFRLDRVVRHQVLDLPSSAPPPSRTPGADLYLPGPDDLVVVLELEPPARWVADYYPCDEVVDLPDGRTRVTLRASSTAGLRRLVLRAGGAARVVEPAELGAEVQAQARAALGRYPA